MDMQCDCNVGQSKYNLAIKLVIHTKEIDYGMNKKYLFGIFISTSVLCYEKTKARHVELILTEIRNGVPVFR